MVAIVVRKQSIPALVLTMRSGLPSLHPILGKNQKPERIWSKRGMGDREKGTELYRSKGTLR